MIRINLLPSEIVEQRRKKAVQFKFLKGLLILAVVFALGFNILFAITLKVKGTAAGLQQQRAQVVAQTEQYLPYQQLQSNVIKRSELIKTAMGLQPAWRDVLGAVGVRIPANVWLTNFSMNKGDEHAVVLLRGLTYDHPSTARWAETLVNTAGIGEVFLSFSAEETVDTKTLVRFEIRLHVAADGEFQPLGRDE